MPCAAAAAARNSPTCEKTRREEEGRWEWVSKGREGDARGEGVSRWQCARRGEAELSLSLPPRQWRGREEESALSHLRAAVSAALDSFDVRRDLATAFRRDRLLRGRERARQAERDRRPERDRPESGEVRPHRRRLLLFLSSVAGAGEAGWRWSRVLLRFGDPDDTRLTTPNSGDDVLRRAISIISNATQTLAHSRPPLTMAHVASTFFFKGIRPNFNRI